MPLPNDPEALASLLSGAGFVAADEEAGELLARAAGDAELLDSLVARRLTGEPLAWITGTVTFCDLEIRVDPGVYVPRWQSEPLARRAVERLPANGTAIDLCTGSGAIAKTLMENRPGARVVASDVDERAVACAAANGVEIYRGDLFAPLPSAFEGRVDVVVGVVPYVPTSELTLLHRDTLTFEAPLSYDGGRDGTDILRRVLAGSRRFLRPGGALLLELGGGQTDALGGDLARLGYVDVTVRVDENGDVRGIEATLGDTASDNEDACPAAPGEWETGAVSSAPDPAYATLAEHDARRARHRWMLEFGSPSEFDDPTLGYRRLFAELIGTFLLVLVAAGGGVLHAKGQITLAAAVVAPGLMVMAIILFMGAVSGAHLNPIVSIAFALRGDFSWKRVPGYVSAQLLGATLACLFLLAVFGNVERLGATLPGPGYHAWQAFLMEIALTGALVSVILGTASSAQNVGTIGALGVGGYIALAGLWAAPVSGASMNPVRSFGPALVGGDWGSYWVYVAGPLIGAVIAVGAARILRGPGGIDAMARAAASGTLRSENEKDRPQPWHRA